MIALRGAAQGARAGAARGWGVRASSSAAAEPKYSAAASRFESLLLDAGAAEQARRAKAERQWYLFRRAAERPFVEEYARGHAEKAAEQRRLTALRRRLHHRMGTALRRPLVEKAQAEAAREAAFHREATRDWDAVRGAPSDVDFAEVIKDGSAAFLQKTRFLDGNCVGDLLPMEAFLFQVPRVFDLDGFYHSNELEDERDNKLALLQLDPENEEKTKEELLYDIYVQDVKDRLDEEMIYKLKKAGLELKDPAEAEKEAAAFAALPKEKRSKKVKPVHADVEFIRTEYIEPKANPHTAFIARKARMKINTNRLNLPEVVKQRLAELAGPRMCKSNGILTIIADEQPNQHQNTIQCMHIAKQLLEEAFLAHHSYVPLSDANQSPLETVEVKELDVPVFVKEKQMVLSETEMERKQEQDAIPEELAMLISDDSEYKQFTDDSRTVEEDVVVPFTLFRLGPSYFKF